jgi:MEMO1 family protein
VVGRRSVRGPVAAGHFYPGASVALAAEVDALLATARRVRGPASAATERLRGIVAPHAGYAYSGPIAATAYALLAVVEPRPGRIVILGPSHFVPLTGWAVPTHDAWRTPLGEAVIDTEARRTALAGGAMADDRPHAAEHSIEVQLPFLQRSGPEVRVLPLAVGEGDPRLAADLLDVLLAADDAFLVVSSDLSHYRDAPTARRLDQRTAAAIEALDASALGPDDACGHHPLRVAIRWAAEGGLRVRLLDLRSSADTAGDPSRVVGYGAFAIERPSRD